MGKYDKDLQDFTVNLPSGPWEVIQENRSGLCLHHGLQSMIVYPKQQGKWLMNTFIHEGWHALCPELSERGVQLAADAITDILWKAGYRRRSECMTRTKRKVKKT